MSDAVTEEIPLLIALPEALFERVVLNLHIREVLLLGLVSHALRQRINVPILWRELCRSKWQECTKLESWLTLSEPGSTAFVDPPSGSAFRGFKSYK